MFFARTRASLDITRVCIDGSQADAAIFVSSDSIYQVLGNAIENFSTSVCTNSAVTGSPGTELGRVAKETDGSGCFSNTGAICEVECAPFAQYAVCGQIPGHGTSNVSSKPSPVSVPIA